MRFGREGVFLVWVCQARVTGVVHSLISFTFEFEYSSSVIYLQYCSISNNLFTISLVLWIPLRINVLENGSMKTHLQALTAYRFLGVAVRRRSQDPTNQFYTQIPHQWILWNSMNEQLGTTVVVTPPVLDHLIAIAHQQQAPTQAPRDFARDPQAATHNQTYRLAMDKQYRSKPVQRPPQGRSFPAGKIMDEPLQRWQELKAYLKGDQELESLSSIQDILEDRLHEFAGIWKMLYSIRVTLRCREWLEDELLLAKRTWEIQARLAQYVETPSHVYLTEYTNSIQRIWKEKDKAKNVKEDLKENCLRGKTAESPTTRSSRK